MDTLAQCFSTVLHDIDTACVHSGRKREDVKLVAVSKTQPALAIETLFGLGQVDFGENYVQELVSKAESLQYLAIVWHFIGPIQSNKTQLIAQWAHWVHSVDRLKIAKRLSEQRPSNLPPLNVCIQVNVSNEEQKSGVAVDEVLPLALAIEQLPNLVLQGIMCVPEATENHQVLAKQFEMMKKLLIELQKNKLAVSVLSMGMSDDMALAIEHGATHVRVGSAIFGARTYHNK
ncbi:YggS family pyridoxal phosphate-dependent enzyme [Neisseria sp. Ec49-e6-T10]|uniref:YggS family pyridoxal phosphate-dependent enzyme n=1 Tax=Neisseria sp. Ec49-e6-T10 TaxID=3140744 RepID=UPI003EBC2397